MSETQRSFFGEAEGLVEPTPPYQRGSATSKAAAEAVRPRVGTDRARILALFNYPPVARLRWSPGQSGYAPEYHDGFTDHEIEQLLGIPLQTVNARRNALVKEGYLVDSGRTRPTPRGRQASVWVLARKDST